MVNWWEINPPIETWESEGEDRRTKSRSLCQCLPFKTVIMFDVHQFPLVCVLMRFLAQRQHKRAMKCGQHASRYQRRWGILGLSVRQWMAIYMIYDHDTEQKIESYSYWKPIVSLIQLDYTCLYCSHTLLIDKTVITGLQFLPLLAFFSHYLKFMSECIFVYICKSVFFRCCDKY